MNCSNVASFSDGPEGFSGGLPFFYLSKMDPTPNDIDSDPRSSLTLSEAPLGSCGGVDVENPTCARLTLSGRACSVSHYCACQSFLFTFQGALQKLLDLI